MRIAGFLLLLLLSLLACEPKEVPDCYDHGDCKENQGCLEGACRWVDCLENASCMLEQFCDTDSYTCVEGCQGDDDCLSGEACDVASQTCVAAGCRDTALDCEYGQICDPESGRCQADERALCEPCDALGDATCPDDGICVMEVNQDAYCQSDEDCMPDESCDEFDAGKFCHSDRCRFECDAEDSNSCPRGWMCQVTQGHPETDTCAAACYWLEQQGILETGEE